VPDPSSAIPSKATAGLVFAARLLVALALLCAFSVVHAQSASVPVDSFVRLSDDEGLTHSDVRAIAQDQEGFIWFGTRIGGLVRYDGYEMKSYQNDPSDPNSLGQVIWSLLADRTGTIWVGTERGLSRFNPATETFVHFRHDPQRADSLPNDVVICIAEDAAGTIWVGTRRGLCRLDDRDTGRFTVFHRPAVVPGSLNKDTFRSIFEDTTTGLLWLGGSDGLAAFDPRSGAFASYAHDANDPESPGANAVNKVIRAPDGVFWAFTESGIDSFVPELTSVPTHSLQEPRIRFHRYANPNALRTPGLNFVRDGLVDHKGRMWLATRSGLQLFERSTGTYRSYQRRPADPTSLSDDIVHTVFEDRTGNLWVGTYGGGVNRLRSEAKPFRTERHNPSDPRSLSDDRIAGLAFDRDGTLWAGTTNGLCRRDASGWTQFLNDPSDPGSLPINDLAMIATAPTGDVWLGSIYGGAIRFDGSRFDRIPSTTSDLPAQTGFQPYTGRQVNSLIADNRGGIWIACRAYGIDYLRDGKIHHYHPGDGEDGLPTANAMFGVFTDDGRLWFVTESRGLVQFDPDSGRFTAYPAPVESGVNGARSLQCITRTDDGMIWVGAADGLLKFDPAAGKFVRQFSKADGLPNNAVMTLVADRRGHLWAGTGDGLADFDPQTERFRVYEKADGLPSDVFAQRSGALGPDGRVYLGTRAGIVSFLPEELHDNSLPPPVAITAVRWLGVERAGSAAALRQSSETDVLEVPPGQLGFAVKFAALDYAAPEKNRYRYRLEGLDWGWINANSRERIASYTSLPPGRYTFHVQASNADGVWNHSGATLSIIIVPRFWETTWFRALLTIAAIGLVVSGLQIRTRAIRRRNVLLENQVTDRTAELKNEIEVRQRAEEALRESHAELETRVQKRTAELAATNANLEAEVQQRRKVEAQLRQSQKMEAIGQLAGGIAHDFNNLLTVILGQSELLTLDLPKPELRASAAIEIKRAAQRAAKLTRQLLVFSRREPMRLAIVDLNQVIGGDIELLRRVLGEDIALETALSSHPFPVLADAGMIQQLLLNLALNARDAMPGGGKLTISTSGVTLTEPEPNRSAHALPGTYARFSVSDTGCGIPPEVLAQIFEPFFTTKEPGKGTGLGLAISQSIMQQHRGWIDVETEVGRGTTFHALLPLQNAPATTPTKDKPRPATLGGASTVLVVEDEVAVRTIATRVLAENGYRVIEASCGAEALERWNAHYAEINVLLTDIIMPGQPNGRELGRQLARSKPALRVVTMSGYDPGALAAGAAPDVDGARWMHLRKPFTAEDLLTIVAAARFTGSR
jgi:signal transduction histidine kinase/ligand-binding sensor domain-containing protein/CheY-like chemotaxis protein